MAEEKEKPLTRKDVLRLIEENGGKAERLDLSGKEFEEGIDLWGLDLKGVILRDAVFPLPSKDVISAIKAEAPWIRVARLVGTSLSQAHLQKADLSFAKLQGINMSQARLEKANLNFAQLQGTNLMAAQLQEAHFEHANLNGAFLELAQLQGARLSHAQLEGAELSRTKLEGASLYGARFSHDTRLEHVDWGNYILGEEKTGLFVLAVDTYRQLKTWYTEHGLYNIAGEFFFREMTAKRKGLKWWPNPIPRVWSKFLSLIFGYGERPLRVIGWAASVVLGLALIYFIIRSIWEWWAFWNSLYFSAVSFTALGYGSWLEITDDWIKGIGAFESFIGVFTMALFLVTFIRKMTR